MAVNTAPLLSFTAKGQIAKTMVMASWKGRPYTRRYVIPANPQSTEQTKTRNAFAWLNEVWKTAPADFVAPWTQFAKGKVLTNRNAFLSKNVGVLRSLTDLTGIVLSPGAAGGLAVTPGITPASQAFTVTLTAPSPLPSGWSIVEAVAVCIEQQNPQSGTAFTITAGTDNTDPYSISLSGLAGTTEYMVGAWFVYQRSAVATDLAYGSSVGASATTLA